MKELENALPQCAQQIQIFNLFAEKGSSVASSRDKERLSQAQLSTAALENIAKSRLDDAAALVEQWTSAERDADALEAWLDALDQQLSQPEPLEMTALKHLGSELSSKQAIMVAALAPHAPLKNRAQILKQRLGGAAERLRDHITNLSDAMLAR